jgi:hypothetical protein
MKWWADAEKQGTLHDMAVESVSVVQGTSELEMG